MKKSSERMEWFSPERLLGHEGILFFLAMGFLVVVLAVIYIFGAIFYQTHFYPGTIINGMGCSNADKVTVMSRLILQSQNYQLDIAGRDVKTGEKVSLASVEAKDIELINSVAESDVVALMDEQNGWLWPSFIWRSDFQYTLSGSNDYSEELLWSFLNKQAAFQKGRMKAPTDAYIGDYSEENGGFVLVAETQGTQLDMDRTKKVIKDSIDRRQRSLDLDERGCYTKPQITAKDAALLESVKQGNRWMKTNVTYDWNGTPVVVNADLVKEWITKDGTSLALDEAAVKKFVTERAEQYDTYGKSRSFHTTLGYNLSLTAPNYGWKTDTNAEATALIALIQDGTAAEKTPAYEQTAWNKGTNDIGNSYVEADLTHQHLYLYQNGSVVLETDFVSGNMSNGSRTPQGVFGITYKTTNAVLRGADYQTPVNYWMPFYGNYGMHDATWREEFGGDIYLTEGSHGCLNLPLDQAASIYNYMSEGFPVVCYYYPDGMLPQPGQEEGQGEGQGECQGEGQGEEQNPDVPEYEQPAAPEQVEPPEYEQPAAPEEVEPPEYE
ncbi:MAG: L,D-transpeptidase/peptidoglycan binding protein [Lachnospiraceae bacterium]|nr:L,D-transpeptidase/peptidoglycan binding protein [Lachnospiraceae bacterium]